MNLIRVFLVFSRAALILGYQNAYEVTQERVDKEYFDKSIGDMTCGVYKSNRTTHALNATATFKYAPRDDDILIITGYKWLSNEYRLDILQFQDTIKNIMNIKYFDVDRLFRNYTIPPLVWPITPGVTYHMFNWIPDSTQFPPGVPEGRWKIRLNYTKADETQMAAFTWYFKIQYKVKYFETEIARLRRHHKSFILS